MPAVSALSDRLLAALGSHGSARFLVELAAQLETPLADIEAAALHLAERSELVLREYACADPHLQGIDLRLAAAVGPSGVEAANVALANRWQQWLRDYLAMHRCA